MAVRVRSRWHCGSRARSMEERATVMAALGWRLAQQAIQRMRKAGFDIDPGPQYFDVVCEFLAFVLHAADRMAFRLVDAKAREQFTRGLAKALARIMDENGAALSGAVASACGAHFVEIANQRGDDYAVLGFDETGTSFTFCCYFGNQVRELMPAKDRSWIVDQVVEIEAPDVLRTLQKALRELLLPPSREPPAT